MPDDKEPKGQQSTEGNGPPEPEFASKGSGKQTSPDVTDDLVDRLWERMESRFDEQSKRILQSQKDKGIARTMKEVQSLGDDVERIFAMIDQGMSREDAMREVDRDRRLELLEQRLEQQSTESADDSPGRDEGGWRERRKRILEDSGIDENSPEYSEFVRSQQWDNPNAFVKALDEWAFRHERSPQASGATAANTASSVGAESDPDLEQEYINAMKEVSGQGAAAGRALRQKYREKGVDVDQIRFTLRR